MMTKDPNYRTVYGRIRREPFVFWFGDKQIDFDEVHNNGQVRSLLESLLPLSAIEVIGLYKLFDLDGCDSMRARAMKDLITEMADRSSSKPTITDISFNGHTITITSCPSYPFDLDRS